MEVEDSLESTKRDPDIRKQVSQLANVDVSIRIIVHRGQYLLINLYIVLSETYLCFNYSLFLTHRR